MDIILEEVVNEFKQWRASRKHARAKFPEKLLKLAGACVVKYGKRTTVNSLNLSTKNLTVAINKFNSVKKNIKLNELHKKNLTVEFFEAKLNQNSVEKESLNLKKELNVILFELENKLGIKLRVFSNDEVLQKNIISAFISGN